MARQARVTVHLTTAEKSTLRRRASSHRTTMAAYLRATALGKRPDTRSGVAVDADDWWDRLSPSRRASIHAWLTQPGPERDPNPGQLAMLEEDACSV